MKRCAGDAKKLMRWVDSHPRTGWYIAVVVTIDFALHLVESL